MKNQKDQAVQILAYLFNKRKVYVVLHVKKKLVILVAILTINKQHCLVHYTRYCFLAYWLIKHSLGGYAYNEAWHVLYQQH